MEIRPDLYTRKKLQDIHESPDMTNVWMNTIGKTVCVQPGQMEEMVYVTIDLETMNIERHSIKKR